MLPCNSGGHAAYQDTFVSKLLKFYPDPFVLSKDTWDYIIQFWYLDLSLTDSIMQVCYSVFGPESFMIFFRLWLDGSDNLSLKDRFPKLKPPKDRKKGDKTPCDSSSAASKLLPLLERWTLKPENPFWLIFKLYSRQFLGNSIERGLADPAHIFLAGDGTPVRTAAQQRKKRLCNCLEDGCRTCNCKRHYSQPDCNRGWDSHSNLPVFPLLERASRHDMLSFLHSFFTMKAYLPEFRIEKLLLDSAHDTYPVYEYCRREDIPVPLLNTAGRYIFILVTIQGCLTHRQGTAPHGKRNLTEGLSWSVPTSVRKGTIN